jgi:hypothetical protein
MDPNRYSFRVLAEFASTHKLTLKQAFIAIKKESLVSDINVNDPWAVTRAKFEHFSQYHHETHQHFSTFYHFGSKCSRIVEFGVFLAVSSWAWVACRPSFLRCIDVERRTGGEWEAIEGTAPQLGIDFAFEIADTGHGALKRIVEERGVSIPQEFLTKDP